MASSPMSITSFPSIQIPGHQAKWTASASWNQADFSYFSCQKRQNTGQILKPPKSYSNKREQTGFLVAQLILNSGENIANQSLAWAEIHLFCRRFSTAFIFYHLEHQLEEHSQDLAFDAAGSLVSMSFFLLKCDQVRLISVTGSPQDLWQDSLHWGKKSEIFSLPNKTCLKPALKQSFKMIRHQQQVISRGEWDESQKNKLYYQKLRYVEKKQERQNIAENLQKTVRRRGLIARIFRPKIEDSLF